MASSGSSGETRMNTLLLLGLQTDNSIAVVRFGASYAGTEPPVYISRVRLGAGKDQNDNIVLLRLNSSGELVS